MRNLRRCTYAWLSDLILLQVRRKRGWASQEGLQVEHLELILEEVERERFCAKDKVGRWRQGGAGGEEMYTEMMQGVGRSVWG